MSDDSATNAVTVSKPRRGWRWLRRALAGLLALLVVVGIAGVSYQAAASAADRRNHPPPGMLVDVGGHRLHLWCAGSGGPTVVLESGLGGFSYDWNYIREDIAGFTRVCAYDRAGYGWSDPVQAPLSSGEVAEDLHDLLTGGGETGPYLLVGHSAGGVHVRSFARLFPDEVAGMVLVDSSNENQGIRMTMLEPLEKEQLSSLKACRLLSPLGLMRVLKVHMVPEDAPIGAEAKAAWLGRMNQNSFCGTAVREYQAFQADIRQTTPPASLGNIPLVVLTRGRDISLDELPPTEGVTQETLDDATRVWLELQEELAGLSTNSTHQIVPDSGHYIHWDQPSIVLEAIQAMVASVQP